jgi:hypothetical protein
MSAKTDEKLNPKMLAGSKNIGRKQKTTSSLANEGARRTQTQKFS